ncbi:uncharacterized protein LOC112053001 [Bicyclus anynana]|uniref:Uncharacterized protein LOC112053001 n=1 Tax=Bicyclus anynana TaxID=110368 RepID=A0ABM3LVP8_BICAN|nr:uncharacterized protein LOC112053001 [Bicyclus anynana]
MLIHLTFMIFVFRSNNKMLRNPNYLYGEDSLLQVPAHGNFAKYVLQKLWICEDQLALINGKTHEQLTYRQMAKDAMNLAVSLVRMGVRKGDTIGICAENRQEYFSACIGIISTGAVLTCINPGYVDGELKHVLNISKPKIIFCSPASYKSHSKTLQSLPFIEKFILFGREKQNNTLSYEEFVESTKDISLDNFDVIDVTGQIDTAVIVYSSGTTGLPKGVMLTHFGSIASCEMSYSMDPKEPVLLINPWYHVMGLFGSIRVFVNRGIIVHLPKFDIDLYMKTIEVYKIGQITVAPPVLIAVCKFKSTYDVSSLKIVYSGAAPLKDDTIAAVRDRFPNLKAVLQGYGMTEITLCGSRHTLEDVLKDKVAGVGHVAPGTVIKIVDLESRKSVGHDQVGEICIKTITIMKGYVDKDNSEDFDDEGFFKTGDIGYYDQDKNLFIVDRLKELIKYKGFQVAPAELEGVLLEHPGIKDAGVVGIPHESAGEVPRAFVVLQPGSSLTEEEIKAFIATKLSNPKHIRGGVKFVAEIPKTPSGKILRKLLREMAKVKSHL